MKKRAYFHEKETAAEAKSSLEKAGISDFEIINTEFFAENILVPDVGIVPRGRKSIKKSDSGLYGKFVKGNDGTVIFVDKCPLTEKIISNHRGIFIE